MPDDMALGNETIIISYLHPNITLQMVDDFRWGVGHVCVWGGQG